MIKKLVIFTLCTVYLFANINDISKKNMKRCKKENNILKENKIDKNFLDEIISSKASDFKDLKDMNRKDKMKECE